MRVHLAIAPMKYLPTLVLAERFLTKYTALNGGFAPIAAWPHILNRFFHIVFRCRLSYGRTKFFVTAQNSISTWLFLSFISKNVLEAASQISANATPLTAESLMCEIPQFRVCDVVGHVHSNPQTYAYETNWVYSQRDASSMFELALILDIWQSAVCSIACLADWTLWTTFDVWPHQLSPWSYG